MPPKRKQTKTIQLESQAEVQPPPPAPAPAPAPAAEPVVEPKKKGKKQPKIVAVVTPDGIQGTFQSEPRRPLIAHLQVNATNVRFYDGPPQYDPNPPQQKDPEPYDSQVDNYFTLQSEKFPLQEDKKEQAQQAKQNQQEEMPSQVVTKSDDSNALQSFVNHDLMVQFQESSSQKKLPLKTDVACYWCAHAFEGMPCILPEREEGGVYKVYGNFCCPECGLAYLLEESLDATTRWERMALLHRLYGPALNYKRIFPAPARSTLKLFGGPLSIGAFRKTIREGKVRIDIQMPPMVSILGSLDTKPIDFYDSSLRNTFSPLLQEILPKAEENLRLKRSKPLKDRESTLDSVMNIQIKTKKTGGLGFST